MMKKYVVIFIVCALLVFSDLVHAQSAMEYLAGDANTAVRMHIQESEGERDGFWRTLFSYMGIRRRAQIRPEVGTTFMVEASAYAPSPYQTNEAPCITASGTRVRRGVAASNFLPFGTIIEVNGERFIIEDRMNPRYAGNYIDLWFPSTSQALEFGRQNLKVVVVGYGSPGDVLYEEEEGVAMKEFEEDDRGWFDRLKSMVSTVSSLLWTRSYVSPDRFDVDCDDIDTKDAM